MNDVVEWARAWILGDPDPRTRAELSALLDPGNLTELADRMDGTLAFGTAGLRGIVEAGSNRMNRATVIRATRGLADFLLARHGGAPDAPVVVGRDARPSSSDFMRDTVGVLSAAGLRVRFWEEEVPTPLVAFAVRVLGACAGVMITASHNPPLDNGYKVYDANGAQIIPPVDAGISAAIDRVGAAAEVPLTDAPFRDAGEGAGPVPPDTWDGYRKELARLRSSATVDPGLRIVYTPMHGVGWRYMRELLAGAGYGDVHPVDEQAEPDGRFPTLPFPNPEEPGAMDLALALAGKVGADLVLANDPDVDRLGVAVPGRNGWVSLTGNQVGVLLADYILSQRPAGEDPRGRQPLVVSTIVSSPMAGLVAAARGARFETTLTGFKWIMNAALDIEAEGRGALAFGFEEALGHAVGGLVYDKDGMSAALFMADLASECRRRGETVLDRLEALYRRFGLWVSIQHSIRRLGAAGASEISGAMRRLAEDPPDALGGVAVVGMTDYREGAERRPRWLGAASLVELRLQDRTRVLVRPSGTEPKLKMYVDSTRPVTGSDDPSGVERDLEGHAGAVVSDLAGHIGL
jgi:phosphomannomutase